MSSQDMKRVIPHRSLGEVHKLIDQSTLAVYERYVMAHFKFQDEDKVKQEKNAAIESLIPGTVFYFHLYFLDLLETKKKVE